MPLAVEPAPKRDVPGDLTDAVRRKGLKKQPRGPMQATTLAPLPPLTPALLFEASNPLFVGMGNPGEAIYPFQDLSQQRLVLSVRLFVPSVRLFVLLLHPRDDLHGLRKRLVPLRQPVQTLLDSHIF